VSGRHGGAVSVPACSRDRPWTERPPEGDRRSSGPVPGPAPCGTTGALSDSSHGVRLKDAPPSTSNARVRSRLAVVPAWRGVLRTGHAVHRACARRSAATSLRAFGPGLPHRDTFRPCRFSRLRRFAPRTRCRSVAPCSRSWGSPGCRLGWPRSRFRKRIRCSRSDRSPFLERRRRVAPTPRCWSSCHRPTAEAAGTTCIPLVPQARCRPGCPGGPLLTGPPCPVTRTVEADPDPQ